MTLHYEDFDYEPDDGYLEECEVDYLMSEYKIGIDAAKAILGDFELYEQLEHGNDGFYDYAKDYFEKKACEDCESLRQTEEEEYNRSCR